MPLPLWGLPGFPQAGFKCRFLSYPLSLILTTGNLQNNNDNYDIKDTCIIYIIIMTVFIECSRQCPERFVFKFLLRMEGR